MDQVLQTFVLYRLIGPGSEWRRHRHWFEHTALADRRWWRFALAEIHRLYECHDKLVMHKAALFDPLTARWRDHFGTPFEVLLHDRTSTYFLKVIHRPIPPTRAASATAASRRGLHPMALRMGSRLRLVSARLRNVAGPQARPGVRVKRLPQTGETQVLVHSHDRIARGLTPRAVLEKFAAVQMLDAPLPATDGRAIVMARHTRPEQDLQLLLDQLKLELPAQGPPKIQAASPPPELVTK